MYSAGWPSRVTWRRSSLWPVPGVFHWSRRTGRVDVLVRVTESVTSSLATNGVRFATRTADTLPGEEPWWVSVSGEVLSSGGAPHPPARSIPTATAPHHF